MMCTNIQIRNTKKIQATMKKVTAIITEMITRTQTKSESNPDHYYIFKTYMILIWNKTHKKENKALTIY